MAIDKQIDQWNAVRGADLEMVHARMGVCGLDEHFHDRWSIGLILSGVCRFNSGERAYRVTPSDIFIIPPYEVHRCSGAGVEVMYQVLYLSEAVLAAHAPHLLRCIAGSHVRTKPLPAPVIAMLREISAGGGAAPALEEGLRRLDGYFRSAEPEAPARAAHPLQEALHRSWDQEIDLGTVERTMVYSRWHGIRTFQRQIGLSPRLYLRQLRALKARHLLLQGKPLAEVAHAMHFADQAHFSRVFKGVFGVSPGKLQRLMRTPTAKD